MVEQYKWSSKHVAGDLTQNYEKSATSFAYSRDEYDSGSNGSDNKLKTRNQNTTKISQFKNPQYIEEYDSPDSGD